MRTTLTILCTVICTFVGIGTAPADPDDLVTAPNAILCMNADSLQAATAPAVAKSQVVLRAMGCLRSEGGVRIQMIHDSPDGSWQVRFYPAGMSGGVVLWGQPSAFTSPDGGRVTPGKRI